MKLDTVVNPEWSAVNSQSLNLLPRNNNTLENNDTNPSSFSTRSAPDDTINDNDRRNIISDCQSTRDRLHKFSPTVPAILFTSASGTDSTTSSSPGFASCSALFVVSTARTVELYSSAEYLGTFRGEPLLPPIPSPNPLFSIHFFIPAKPAVKPPLVPGSMTLHRLIIQGTLPPTRFEPSFPITTITPDNSSTNPVKSMGVSPFPFLPNSSDSTDTTSPLASHAFSSMMSAAATSMHTFGSPTIDFEAVRALLGQITVDDIPQGAKNLFKIMEMQAASTSSATSGSIASDKDIASPGTRLSQDIKAFLPPLTYPNESPTTGELESRLQASASRLENDISPPEYVTRSELEEMEIRIMNTIDKRLQEMEDRIIERLLKAQLK
ncbi:hypothetical protein BGZ46_008860 [Entomortierella lignicola]|nr:hypothetical protein BGZ46_008860 [Entomortierella lignicola]